MKTEDGYDRVPVSSRPWMKAGPIGLSSLLSIFCFQADGGS
jgi:hypothetical protein